MSENPILPTELTIPSEEDETPARHLNGMLLANPAYICRPKDLWPKGYKELKPEWVDPIERYLASFARPIRTIADEIKCVACDRQVTGHHVGLADWRFKTALTYSPEGTMEGRCNGCGYPVRVDHKMVMSNGGPLLVHLKGFPLFYHPIATQRTS